MKNTTNYTPVTKNTTDFNGDDGVNSILVNDTTATLDSLVYYLHGYTSLYPPNQNSSKDSTSFSNISKSLTSYS